MAFHFLHLLFSSLSLLLLPSHASSSSGIPQRYIVYMGESMGEGDQAGMEVAKLAHLQLLSTVIPSEERERISVEHIYHHAFRGFSAILTEKEASLISGHDEVISVFRDPILKLHTTRSWDFLDEDSGIRSNYHYKHSYPSTDVIIGVIDTGIWPESPSFSDQGFGDIPKRWKGVCMESSDFKKSNCNRKLIGARYYNSGDSSNGTVRDFVGHGTHVASTAAGVVVGNASYFGLARGAARGGWPSARLAVYKPCSSEGCSGCLIMKAIDDAIKDGVDIISISIGLGSTQPDYLVDPIAIGAFHAQRRGIMVVCSAGNDGPEVSTAGNLAPWIFTVAASTIDRKFQSTVILGNGARIAGSGINLSNLTAFDRYDLVLAEDVAADSVPLSESRNCYPGSLDSKKVAGKIVVCLDTDPNVGRRIKMLVVEEAGARGLLYISDKSIDAVTNSAAFPMTQVRKKYGVQISKYIKSTKKPTATILATVVVPRIKPAPVVAYFSSRGPGQLTEDILKPDIMAPGVSILAAFPPEGENPTNFALRSGTSMSCPHVSGAAAFIKSIHHDWTPSMIKSALMTTATITDNTRRLLTNSSGVISNPHEAGVGEISPLKALHPGLVFPTTTLDYMNFLCYYGHSEKSIRSMSNNYKCPDEKSDNSSSSTTTMPCSKVSNSEIESLSSSLSSSLKNKRPFKCPKGSKSELISNINYPSISIGELKRNRKRTIIRHVMNVESSNSTYRATVHAPRGLSVKVSPNKMVFHEGWKKASFKVSFFGKQAQKGYNYGLINWCDGQHNVQVVYAVNIVE